MDPRDVFYTELNNYISNINKPRNLISREDYEKTLNDYQLAIENKKSKSSHEYHLLRRFIMVENNGIKKLAMPPKKEGDSAAILVVIEDIYDILFELHLITGHGCRDRLESELNGKFAFIPRTAIEIFLETCGVCQERKRNKCSRLTPNSEKKKAVVEKPIVSDSFNLRCQFVLIDMQNQPDGKYKFIMVYQDHLTKFVQLRALKTKTSEEVVEKLRKIFSIFGAPQVLQSDNGFEFDNALLNGLTAEWHECQIVHGKPSHCEWQGSVQRANRDIENMLYAWMKDHNSTNWSRGILDVQFMKNNALNKGIGRSPYHALFGFKPKTLPRFSPATSTTDSVEVVMNAISSSMEPEIIHAGMIH